MRCNGIAPHSISIQGKLHVAVRIWTVVTKLETAWYRYRSGIPNPPLLAFLLNVEKAILCIFFAQMKSLRRACHFLKSQIEGVTGSDRNRYKNLGNRNVLTSSILSFQAIFILVHLSIKSLQSLAILSKLVLQRSWTLSGIWMPKCSHVDVVCLKW